MSTQQPHNVSGLDLEFPQSLAVYDDYAAAQKSVDFLSDNAFPVQNCMIVGTDLKQVERITGCLTKGRVALAGALSGLWLGLFVGLIFS
ncbi:MAG: general stress protein, partial [Nocardioides sp.]